jgi:hypothetical protein
MQDCPESTLVSMADCMSSATRIRYPRVQNSRPQSTLYSSACHGSCKTVGTSAIRRPHRISNTDSNPTSKSTPLGAPAASGWSTETASGAGIQRPPRVDSSPDPAGEHPGGGKPRPARPWLSALIERLWRLERCPLVPRSQPPDDPDHMLDPLIDLVGQPPGERPERHRPESVASNETRGVLAAP